jgi:hypothetical protein
MTDAAGEHVEQDAAIKHPCDQVSVRAGQFHGRGMYQMCCDGRGATNWRWFFRG